jgi:protein-tyrosine phosphatase
MTMAATGSTPIRLSGSAAFRDLGGAPALDGGRLRYGRLFRADALSQVDAHDRATLDQLNLRLICDLRSATERTSTPCLDWLDPAPRRLHLELSAGLVTATLPFLERLRRGPDPEAARALMETTYAHLPQSAAPFLAQLFESLLAGEWPLLVHCTAGKDRTGFTVAMILTALDVEPDFIRDDYLRGSGRNPLETEQPSTHIMDALIGRRLTDEESRFVHAVDGSYLDTAYARIAHDWGDALTYLERAAGLDGSRRARLREQFLT